MLTVKQMFRGGLSFKRRTISLPDCAEKEGEMGWRGAVSVSCDKPINLSSPERAGTYSFLCDCTQVYNCECVCREGVEWVSGNMCLAEWFRRFQSISNMTACSCPVRGFLCLVCVRVCVNLYRPKKSQGNLTNILIVSRDQVETFVSLLDV